MRAIIFDFDGVIVDSEPLHEEALRVAARELGMDFTREKYFGEYVGYDDRDLYAAVARDNSRVLSAAELARFGELKRRSAMDLIAAGRAVPWPGAVELVREAAEVAPLAVCSGALRAEIEPVLGALKIRSCFREVVSADDVEKSKPDPACYLLTAERLGMQARACTAIEDTPTGARAARDAGMRVVGVCHTVARREMAGVAHRVVERIAELRVLELLEA